MKKSTILYFVFVFSVVTSCHKKEIDVVVNKDMSTQEMLVNYLLKQKDITTTSANFIDTLMVKANWSNISSTSISKEVSLYYVPLVYNSNNTGLSFLYNNNTHQVYYSLINEIPKNTSTNIAHGTVASVNRPIDVIAGFYKYNMNGYTGSIRAYNLSNNLLWEYGYENGVTKFEKWVTSSTDELPSSSSAQIKSSSIASKSVKANGCLDWYLVTWYDDGSSDWKFIGTTCDGNCLESIGIAKDSTMIKSNCNGTGGGGGSGYLASKNIIITRINNKCLKILLEKLISSNNLNNNIGNILASTFGVSDKVNIVFVENNNLIGRSGLPILGNASITNGETNYNNITVQLNANLMSKYSQETQTLTIMHEVLHGYLIQKYKTQTDQTLVGHVVLLKDFINNMANSLIDIFPGLIAHPNLAQALAIENLRSSVGINLAGGDIPVEIFNQAILSLNAGFSPDSSQNNYFFNTAVMGLYNDSEYANKSPCSQNNQIN